MAKVLGSLVGAVISAAKGFPAISNFLKDGSDHILMRDQAQLTSANVIGDSISLGTFKSGAFLSPMSKLWWDAGGTGVKFNIGDATHASALASALDVSAAGSGDLWKTFTAANMGQPLWKALGYSTDPGGTIELLATVANANVVSATMNVAWQITGINR